MRQSAVGLWKQGYFLGDFLKTSLALPFALFLKMRVLGDLAKIVVTFGAAVCAKILSSLCTLSAF